MAASTGPEPSALVLQSLRLARGRYSAERAAQLSGIPRSTLYDWQRNDVYVPDFAAVNNLAIQSLVAAFADNKSIVDESSARAAVTEVTTE